jgi:hypothetical protein
MTQTAHEVTRNDSEGLPVLGDKVARLHELGENGYVVFRNLVSKEKLAQLRTSIVSAFEREKASGSLFAGGGLISGHLNCFPGEGSRFAYETLRSAGVMDFIISACRRATEVPRVGLNYNLPGSVAQHYHADSFFTEEFMIANVAVVDTDLVNGAIDVLPGTQKKAYPYWRFALERANRLTTRIPMQQGDVLVRSSNLWHRGMPNRASVARPMMAMTFGDVPATADDPFRIGDGSVKFFPNWYRPDFLGRLRERTFVTAPITYSAYRFVSSLVGKKQKYGTP